MRHPGWKLLLVGLPLVAGATHFAQAADEPEPTAAVTPAVRYVTVHGDEHKFREDWWIKEGWAGGIEEATLDQKLNKDWELRAEGRALFDQEDYKLRLEIVNPSVGFVRAGYTEYRKYYDDQGGFFRSFAPSSFGLDRDLHLDIGNIFIEAGLTLPNIPKITLGYERQFRDGGKSLLEWGAVTQGATTRNIYPSFKDVNERVDIFKAEVEHDIKNIHLVDQFRFERDRNDTKRSDTAVDLNAAASKTVTIREDYHQDSFLNTFHMDSHFNEKVYWSLGYLFNSASGSANLNVNTPPPLGPFDRNWLGHAFDLEAKSHVVNLNALFGPFAGLSIYGGLQAEKTDSEGSTDALLANGLSPASTNLIHSTNHQKSLEETAGLRYTKIPFTTLYAEGRWTEQMIDQFENQLSSAAPTLTRDTDACIFRQAYTIGFNTAPLPRLTLAGRYRHSIYENDYSHEVDTVPGYPAFITAQDFTMDEAMAKLTLRPCSKFSISLQYQWVATDIHTTTESVPVVAPGGSLESGDYDANIYTVSATVTPINRLWLTGLFSFQDTRTRAFANDDPSIQTYKGDVYTVLGAAGYALDEKTDASLEYTFSRSANFSDNSANGLPLGLDYHRHGLVAGLSRHITKNVIARLRYGYFEYRESSNGGIANYRAHLASASCTVRF